MGERNAGAAFTTLRRLARQPSRDGADSARPVPEQCELCGEPIPPAHRHLVEVTQRELKCVCQACSILFSREAASQGKYLLVPDRRLYLADFQLSDAQWEGLQIPVGLAFFFHSTSAGKPVAIYPSPVGPTESLLDLETWGELAVGNPILRGMQPDVEALLVNRARGAREHFLVPIDECYRLVGLVRLRWRGLGGGQEIWNEMACFFDVLRQRSQTITSEGEQS